MEAKTKTKEITVSQFIDYVNGKIIDITRYNDNNDYYVMIDDIRVVPKAMNSTCTTKFFVIPNDVQNEFYAKYSSLDIKAIHDFVKLVIYLLMKLDVNKIISDIDADEFICADDIEDRNNKLVLTSRGIQPDAITKLIPKPGIINQNIMNESRKKTLVILFVNDVRQLTYFSKRFTEMYEECNFYCDITVILRDDRLSNETKENIFPVNKTINGLIKNIFNFLGTVVKVFGSNLTNTIKSFYSYMEKSQKTLPTYHDIIKLDTQIECHKVREELLWEVFGMRIRKTEKDKKYSYANHPYVCYLLNILKINKFPEQKMEFSLEKHDNLERKKQFNCPNYFYCMSSTIVDNKLWMIEKEIDEGKNKNENKYMSISQASQQLLNVL